jgi:hypothetical protein
MMAYVLPTVMITRTVRYLLQPNGEIDIWNDMWESSTTKNPNYDNTSANPTPQNHHMEYETRRPYNGDKKACDLTLYGITRPPIFRRVETPVPLGPDTVKGTIKMQRWHHPVQCCATHGSYIPQYNTIIEDNEEKPWSVGRHLPTHLHTGHVVQMALVRVRLQRRAGRIRRYA